jgi:hypothetical protein
MDNREELLYFKIKSRNHLSININNRKNEKYSPSIYLEIRSSKKNNILFTKNVSDEDDIELTNYFSRSHNTDINEIN